MKMIVGLGNIGTRYDETRHNTGFMVVEQLARDYHLGAFTHLKQEAVAVTGMINGEKVMIVKPTTFMNDSGRAVGPLVDYYDIDLDDLVVVNDDLDMPVGKVRLKTHGASGGHNGLKSIINALELISLTALRSELIILNTAPLLATFLVNSLKKNAQISTKPSLPPNTPSKTGSTAKTLPS